MGCGDEKLSKYLTQTFTAHCNAMICQQVTLLGDAEWPKVADAVIEALLGQFHTGLILLCFTTRLDLSAVGQERFFKVSPDILHRMEMVRLKSGMRIDRLDSFCEALRVIGEGGRDMQSEG